MKKSLTALLVITLSMIGFKAYASNFDKNVLKRAKIVSGSDRGGDNWETGNMKVKTK